MCQKFGSSTRSARVMNRIAGSLSRDFFARAVRFPLGPMQRLTPVKGARCLRSKFTFTRAAVDAPRDKDKPELLIGVFTPIYTSYAL